MAPALIAQSRALHRLPIEVWTLILLQLEPAEIVVVRNATRAMYAAGTSHLLWNALLVHYEKRSIPIAWYDCKLHDSFAQALERSLLVARRVSLAWQTHGAQPKRVVRFRAHANRITSIKMIPGCTASDYWLITGSVDGFVRVWDVHRALSQNGAMDVTPELHQDMSLPEDAVPVDPATDIRRSSNAFLVAEVDTGGDVTSIDASMDRTTRTMRIAVGSYYNAAACFLYELHLDTLPHIMDLCATLDPPEWCGTQCVSLLHDVVAVGTYTGRVYLLHWHTGERCMLEHAEPGSIAALKLLPLYVISITRLGSMYVYERFGTTQARLIAQHTLSPHPILSVSFGESCMERAGQLASGTITDPTPLAVMCADPVGVSHWVWRSAEELTKIRHLDMPPERLIGASIGALGRCGLITTSLGGVPPVCSARAYTQGRTLCSIRPTPELTLPEWNQASPPTPPTPPLPQGDGGSPAPSQRRRARVDSFSSTSTTSSIAPAPSSRVDMLTESALDEARGLVCLASVRGAVWISDYGNSLDTM